MARRKYAEEYTQLSIKKEDYWKLAELKAKLKVKTWHDLITKIYEIIMEGEAPEAIKKG